LKGNPLDDIRRNREVEGVYRGGQLVQSPVDL
jgi:hypothetical protein